ncbi:MAG: mechanosensitive ion channel family protein [Gemmatimonadota bacterium]
MNQIDLQAWWETVRDFALPRLITSGGLLLLTAVAYLTARWLLRRIERWLEVHTQTEFDDALAQLARRAALLSIAFWAVWRLAHIWELPSTSRGVVAAWIVALTLPLSGFAADVLHLLERRVAPRTDTRLDDTALPLLNKIARFLVVAAGILVALEYVGIDISPLLAGAGVMGLAISLAAKDTLSNVIAGILLILDRPFQVGDRIELWTAPQESGTWGDVVEIGLRATKIRNPDNVVVVVPNNEIMRRDIINYTTSGPEIRLRVPIGIAYDADVELAKELILQVASEVGGVKAKPEPVVIVRSFGDSAVNLELRVWIEEARQRRAVADDVTERVKATFDARGVEIPYPKRDLYIRTAPGETGSAQPARPAGDARRAPEGSEAAGDAQRVAEGSEAAGDAQRVPEDSEAAGS